MSKLETAHGPFVELIGLGRVFVVPDYQRAYSWKAKKQVAELWGDILRLYRHRVDEDSGDSHFIGSVVVGSASTKALGPVECPVIDGQQRLITLSLVLAAIRDELVHDDSKRMDITSQYLAHRKSDGEISSTRVRPGDRDRRVFEAIIHGEDVSDRKSLVMRAYEYIVEQLELGPYEDIDPDEPAVSDVEQDPEDLDEGISDEEEEVAETALELWKWETLLEVVGTKLELVSISDVAPENAYQIFATLNSTGLPLAQVDLIRNSIFMLMPKGGTKAHRELWVPMESVMGKDLLQSYLHTWVIRRGHNVPAKEVYRSAVFEFSRVGTKESDIRKVLKELHSSAWTYLLITRPTSKDRARFGTGTVPKSIISALERLRAWGTVPMEPVLLEILERFRNKKLSGPQVLKQLSSLESFVVRRFVVQVPPNDLRSIFARLTQQISKKTTAQAFERALLEGLQEKARRWPTDAELEDAFLRRALYRKPGTRQSFFVLKRIAEHMEGKESPQIVQGVSATDYSIEHILPQNLTMQWQKDLATWKDPNPQETWLTHRHTIGNLTLTAYNSELADKPFSSSAVPMDKKRWISEHLRLKMSRSVLDKDQWTRAEIEARSKEMSKVAVKIWPRSS